MPAKRVSGRYSAEGCGLWTAEEHKRFMSALEIYPNGPWKKVSELVVTRNARQTMTHAQKYRQKLARHERGLRPRKKPDACGDEAQSPPSKPRLRAALRQEKQVESAVNAHELNYFKEEANTPHYQDLLPYEYPSWPATASPVDVSIGGFYPMKSTQPTVPTLTPYFSDELYASHFQHSHHHSHLRPLDPRLAFDTQLMPPSTEPTLPLDPLPLVPGAEDPKWIDECYDLFVGAVV